MIKKLKSELEENINFSKNVNVNFAGEDEDIKETQSFLGQSLSFFARTNVNCINDTI